MCTGYSQKTNLLPDFLSQDLSLLPTHILATPKLSGWLSMDEKPAEFSRFSKSTFSANCRMDSDRYLYAALSREISPPKKGMTPRR